VKQELVKGKYKKKLHVTIVWTPMMESDSEETAREAAQMFAGTRVEQFYDPENRVGLAFRQQVFPDAHEKAIASLPPDHWLHAELVERGSDYGDRPEWDIYMFFDQGATWGDSAPRPFHFVRHLGRVGEEGESLMWIDDYSNPPVEGELAESLADRCSRAVAD
jgi:hypothetical protein